MSKLHHTLKESRAHPRILLEIRSLIEAAQQRIAATANLALVSLYWNIGRVITEDIQQNTKRAGYRELLLENLSEELRRDYGQGFSRANLQDMRRFFEQFAICQTLSSEFTRGKTPPPARGGKLASSRSGGREQIRQTVSSEFIDRVEIDLRRHFHLGWSHYRLLLPLPDPGRRRFYFEQAAAQRWSVRAFQRKIEEALYERVALSRDTQKLIALERKKAPAELLRFEDAFKDPYLLDFLGLKGAYSERDLEAAIVANLQEFLSELGSDFCFVGRQYPMRIDDVDYYLDLLFYHRGLRCMVAVDLKLGAFSAADKGQMDLYLAWLKKHEWRQGENEPVGLVLCTSKRRQHVEMLLHRSPHKMHVSEYHLKLPNRALLEERLKVYSQLLIEDGESRPRPASAKRKTNRGLR